MLLLFGISSGKIQIRIIFRQGGESQSNRRRVELTSQKLRRAALAGVESANHHDDYNGQSGSKGTLGSRNPKHAKLLDFSG